MAIDAQLQQDLNRVVSALRKIEPTVRKSGKADLMEAAKILESAVKGRTPVGEKAHSRYSARKGKKAAKGSALHGIVRPLAAKVKGAHLVSPGQQPGDYFDRPCAKKDTAGENNKLIRAYRCNPWPFYVFRRKHTGHLFRWIALY